MGAIIENARTAHAATGELMHSALRQAQRAPQAPRVRQEPDRLRPVRPERLLQLALRRRSIRYRIRSRGDDDDDGDAGNRCRSHNRLRSIL